MAIISFSESCYSDLNIITNERTILEIEQQLLALRKLGYTKIGLNYLIRNSVSDNRPQRNAKKSLERLNTHFIGSDILKRVTICVGDTSESFGLNQSSESFSSFDLISVRPTNQDALKSFTNFKSVDIISLDFNETDYHLRPNIIRKALKNDIYFEISYSSLIEAEKINRPKALCKIASLIRYTKAKNLIITSGSNCGEKTTLRAPNDVIALSFLFGLTESQVKKIMIENVQQLLYRAKLRRDYELGVVVERKTPESCTFKIVKKDCSPEENTQKPETEGPTAKYGSGSQEAEKPTKLSKNKRKKLNTHKLLA